MTSLYVYLKQLFFWFMHCHVADYFPTGKYLHELKVDRTFVQLGYVRIRCWLELRIKLALSQKTVF